MASLGIGAVSPGLPGRATVSVTATSTRIDPVASVRTLGANDFSVGPDRTTAYVPTVNGFVVVDVTDSANPTVLARRPAVLDDHEGGPIHGHKGMKVSDGGDRALLVGYLSSDREEDPSGVVVRYDISNPEAPQRLDVYETPYLVHNADLSADGETAFLTGSLLPDWPLVVVDFAGGDPEEVTRWSVVDRDSAWADVDRGVRRLHDVFVRDGRAYLAYWDAGTWVLDVTDPASPSVVTRLGGRNPGSLRDSAFDGDWNFDPEVIEAPGNATGAWPSPDRPLVAVAKEAFDHDETDRIGGPGGIDVWDVSEPSSPERVTTLAPPRAADTAFAKNLGWEGDRLYTAWRDAGTWVFDLSTPREPLLLDGWPGLPTTTIHTARPTDGGFAALDIVEHSSGRAERLYLFPDPDGTEATPARTGRVGARDGTPPSVDPVATPSGTPTATATETPTATPSSTPTATTGSATDSTSATDRPTTESSATTTDPGDGPPTTTTDGQPGFGLLGVLAGSGVAVWRLSTRRAGSGDGDSGESS